ncbi:hypothetical protein BA899_09610 [Spiribacter sp. SSL99]|uniref:SDR family NAD(P)-dependent oxidoreductase n=1 Tax=Spiribacter sp. SSL99 TaxID=1866884 RepID=UPI00132F93E9|nr:SDR family NAD(P)-dependent oxidoreductase [Spiribacter sp. SSL99]KAF0286401.1 hypothetical protein BA899_09610 [Spiribacter sp. SSL99]
MKILVTGAAGYIGSHAALALLDAGHEVIGLDNFVNGSPTALERVEALSGRPLTVVEADIRDEQRLAALLAGGDADVRGPVDAVMHFAGLKAVGESTEQPLSYYDNNVGGTLALARAMAGAGVRRLIFSSSATAYGDHAHVPIPETAPVGRPATPYGTSKEMIERILMDLSAADPHCSVP